MPPLEKENKTEPNRLSWGNHHQYHNWFQGVLITAFCCHIWFHTYITNHASHVGERTQRLSNGSLFIQTWPFQLLHCSLIFFLLPCMLLNVRKMVAVERSSCSLILRDWLKPDVYYRSLDRFLELQSWWKLKYRPCHEILSRKTVF